LILRAKVSKIVDSGSGAGVYATADGFVKGKDLGPMRPLIDDTVSPTSTASGHSHGVTARPLQRGDSVLIGSVGSSVDDWELIRRL